MNDLSFWQQRLADHFSGLASQRRGAREGTPVFALESGLEATDLQGMTAALHAHISRGGPLAHHDLAWIVYAAEIGYGYAGDEYWQTFEEQTPGWTTHGDRYWIRSRYQKFQKTYGGAQPSGAWADHFSIICWPITHAILPRDLQRQLARVLYELRHFFSAEVIESTQQLGELIGSRSWSATSRFQSFAEQTHLVGQVAAALLLEGQPKASSLLHPAALRRIGADLDRERQAREWLRGARRAAQERKTLRGLALGRGTTSATVRRTDEARAEVAALGIEPRLMLRPRASDASSWEVLLEIPDLSHLLLRFPKTRDILTKSRCVVAGSSGRPLAGGRCLHGAQRVTLPRWPRDDEVLLQFEEEDAQLQYLLRTECLLRPGPRWLFRIASDGIAYESRSLRVRPGERYVLVSTAGPIATDDHVRAVQLECEGVRGALLELPAALTGEWQEALRRFGIGQARTVEIWPAGLGPALWDGEGHGEWLASERPCLAIRTDHPVAALIVSLDPVPALELSSITPGEPIFVQFPQLPVGLHTVRICSRSSSAGEAEPLGDLNVLMRVREARPWTAGVARSGPLVVQVDPPAPTMEQLWEGQVDIDVWGPTGCTIRCVLSLFEGIAGEPTITVTIPPVPLPLQNAMWHALFEQRCREDKKVQEAYDGARLCRLVFVAEELGTFTVECERAFAPLRWVLRHRGGGTIARLVDDSGAPEPASIVLFRFDKPTEASSLTPSLEFPVVAPGGLFAAHRGGERAGLIAVPGTIRSLADLATTPEIKAGPRSVDEVLVALEHAGLWQSARSSGDILSQTKRRSVLQALTRHILCLLGGDQWARAETAVEGGRDAELSALKKAVASRRDQVGVAAAIALETDQLAAAEPNARVARLAELARSFRIVTPGVPEDGRDPSLWLAELSLRVASSPAHAALWAGPHLRPSIQKLLEEVPVLVRAARFMVIATDRHLQSRVASGELYASWGWA